MSRPSGSRSPPTPWTRVGTTSSARSSSLLVARFCTAAGSGTGHPRSGGPMTALADMTRGKSAELDRSKVVDIDLGGSAFKQNAHRLMAEWARSPPFYVLSYGPPQVVCGRYADVQEVFADPERFSSEMPRGRGFEQFDKFMGLQFITQMDGERHARIRRLLLPAFSARSLARLASGITGIVDAMLDAIENGADEFDAMEDFGAQLVGNALLTAMLNLDEHQKQAFLAFHDVLPRTTYTKPGEPFPPECVAAFDRAGAIVNQLIAEKRTTPGADFISDLIAARDQGDKLTDRELFDQIFTICGAALSATSRSAGGTLYTLYTHPDQLAELVRDPSLIPAAIEECLRLASNGYFTFPRIATRDTEVGGTRILKGMVVRPSPLAANYDPDVFPDPLRFDIRRNPKRIMAFGTGPHHCIGNILGRTTITIAITRLLARFPSARLADPDFVPSYGGAVGELRLEHLPIRIH
ncbi:MAG: cytochrome P450 [Rhizobiales bacterium]|nr:cytochrome P450 [Hyphomicrobiales bacterium]